mmetsp:Transcript_21323/g.50028  ORF Transcript_21323/g.50028 Transcript_21323/m.50028 type:complete len:236 (+) Transcript_21323:1780-2487(+)
MQDRTPWQEHCGLGATVGLVTVTGQLLVSLMEKRNRGGSMSLTRSPARARVLNETLIWTSAVSPDLGGSVLTEITSKYSNPLARLGSSTKISSPTPPPISVDESWNCAGVEGSCWGVRTSASTVYRAPANMPPGTWKVISNVLLEAAHRDRAWVKVASDLAGSCPMNRIPPHCVLKPKLYAIGAVIRNDSAVTEGRKMIRIPLLRVLPTVPPRRVEGEAKTTCTSPNVCTGLAAT